MFNLNYDKYRKVSIEQCETEDGRQKVSAHHRDRNNCRFRAGTHRRGRRMTVNDSFHYELNYRDTVFTESPNTPQLYIYF